MKRASLLAALPLVALWSCAGEAGLDTIHVERSTDEPEQRLDPIELHVSGGSWQTTRFEGSCAYHTLSSPKAQKVNVRVVFGDAEYSNGKIESPGVFSHFSCEGPSQKRDHRSMIEVIAHETIYNCSMIKDFNLTVEDHPDALHPLVYLEKLNASCTSHEGRVLTVPSIKIQFSPAVECVFFDSNNTATHPAPLEVAGKIRCPPL